VAEASNQPHPELYGDAVLLASVLAKKGPKTLGDIKVYGKANGNAFGKHIAEAWPNLKPKDRWPEFLNKFGFFLEGGLWKPPVNGVAAEVLSSGPRPPPFDVEEDWRIAGVSPEMCVALAEHSGCGIKVLQRNAVVYESDRTKFRDSTSVLCMQINNNHAFFYADVQGAQHFRLRPVADIPPIQAGPLQ